MSIEDRNHAHEHTHEHDHEHGHAHEHDDACCCGHEHEHEHGHPASPVPHTRLPLRVYLIDNLDCANCAAKIERKIQALPGVEYAAITFATRQLRIAAEDQEALLPLIREACTSIEPDATVTLRQDKSTKPAEDKADSRKTLVCIIGGALLLAAGKLLESYFPILSIVLLITAYLLLGLEIILTALRNLFRGNIFDENFLMSIATIGAFAVQNYAEAVGVMLFYRIGEWFEDRAVAKSRSQIMDALDLRPENVNLVENGSVRVIPAEEAAPGDLILIRPGDRIPLDGVLTEGESRIDTSPVTGESVPVAVRVGSRVFSGCMNGSGVIYMQVEKPLSESMVTRILDSVENAAASKPKIDRFITRFSRVYTPLVVVLALCTAVIPSLLTGEWHRWIYTALTFLVISCPCALVLSVPLAFFSGIGAGSRQGILFKGGASLEALQHIRAVVMDKTGTLTKGNFAVQQIVSLKEGLSEDALLALAASCEASSTHPIAVSICEAAEARALSFTKKSSVKELAGHGIISETAGGTLLCGNRKLMEARGIDTSAYTPARYGTEVLLAENGSLCGYLVIADTIKPEAAEAVHILKQDGILTAMLTGDAAESAAAVAQETGVDEVYAKLLPGDKLSKLSAIRDAHGAVMFVGDGINDAPVLAGADVGAAMGSGADAAIEAADVVFLNSNLSCIPSAIRIARSTGRVAAQNVVFALAVKALVMILGLVGIASMWLAVFADSGVAMLCILNSVRILYQKQK